MNASKPIITGGLRRPSWVCRNVRQGVILVRDRSGSMAGQKAQEASAAINDLINELARPDNKDGFLVGIVDFDSTSAVIHPLTSATTLQGIVQPITPGGDTNVTAGLGDAQRLLRDLEANPQPGMSYLRPVVMLYTDGGHNTGPEPRPIAGDIKKVADVVTIAFGANADEALLRDLASTPQHFYRCNNGAELRQFLAAVGATMTGTMAQGVNAGPALTKVPQ